MSNSSERLQVVRPDDLLVLDVECINLRVSADGRRLERIKPDAPAILIVHLPSQHVAERAFFEFEQSLEPTGALPVGAFAAGPSRLCFSLFSEQQSIDLSLDGLLGWWSLVPRLAPNALPKGVRDGPSPALPAEDQTAIEFPYRLLLSPDATGRWIHRHEPFTVAGRTELWHTGLSGSQAVRAIARRQVPDTFRTSLSDRDLRDIVTLSSDFSIRPKSWTELRIPYYVWGAQLRALRLLGFHYVPLPLDADELILTPLGASARLRGRWNYPEPDQDPVALQSFGMVTPSLEQYEHIAGLGRDQYVRVVRRGFVHAGMRASLVKVTERRFEPQQLRTEQTAQGHVGIFGATAYLRQYFKVIIQEPEIDYNSLAGGYQDDGREMPLRQIRLTTLETPKIDLPGGVAPDTFMEQARVIWMLSHRSEPVDEAAIGQLAQSRLEKSFMNPFWITVAQRDFEFGFIAKDWEGRTISGSMPLLFVPYEAVTNTPDVLNVFAQGAQSRRTRSLGNQKIAIADPTGSAPGSTVMPAEALTFKLQSVPSSRESLLPTLYRPRWVMAIDGASVHLESVAQITGNDSAVSMTFDPAYLSGGLGGATNIAGVFAVVPPVKVGFAGQKGGALARPDTSLDRISSRQGAMASTFTKPSVTVADLGAMFGGAKLFGTIDLKEILAGIDALPPDQFGIADLPDADLTLLLQNPDKRIQVPILRARPLIHNGLPYATEARFLWKPRLESNKQLVFDDESELVLDARITTPLDGGEPTSEIRGELRHFNMSFFGVVNVHVDLLRFVSLPGRKPDISAEGLNLEFEGPLGFVNTLSSVVPSDGFADGPAIEITPEGITAGYSLGLPTVGVGIFSLQNLSLSTALSVPFGGKPAGLRFAISERHHPFLVTVTLFGGGGFFALGVSANGVEEIEAAIEFGGNVALNIAVASGGVYVMAGVYFGRTGDVAILTGYLRCGGYLSVLGLITISVEFYLAFTYQDKGGGRSEVWGQADVTVCVKVAAFSKSVTLSLERRFAGAGGDPTLDQVLDLPAWQNYCQAFAAETI